MTKNKPTKQHFNPKMILKNFTDQQNNLWYFDKAKGIFEQRTPKGVFWEKHRYTRYVDGGAWGDWEAEDKLAGIENEAEPVFGTIIDAARLGLVPMLSAEKQAICVRFYVYMVHRNPKWASEMLREMGMDDAIYEGICIALNRVGMPPPTKEVFDTAEGFREIKKMFQHNTEAGFGAGLNPRIDKAIEYLVDTQGLFIGVTKDPVERFILGDCGVTRDENDENRAFTRLPIAPDVAISVRPDSGNPHFSEMEPDQVSTVNSSTWSQSSIVVAKCRRDLERVIHKETALGR